MYDPYIDFFRNYHEYMTELGGFLNLTSYITSLFRAIGWWLIKVLRSLCASVEDIFYDMFDLLDILRADSILSFLQKTGYFALALAAIPIALLGYKLITNDDFNLQKAAHNIVYSIVILITITSVVSMLSDLTQVGMREFYSLDSHISEYDLTMADRIVADSVTDLAYKYENSTKSDKAKGVITGGIDNDPNNLSMKEIDLIDINELICYSIEGDDNPFVYRYTMDKDGEVRMEHFEDNITGTKWLDELIAELHNQKTSYARYHVDFFNLILCLLALAVAYICAVYKICQIIFELLISEIVLQFAAVLDMSGTERTKKVVANIVNSFLALFAMAILFRLYSIIYTIIMGMEFLEGHSLIRTIAVIAFSFGILNGPNVIKNILGVDVGFNDFSRGISSLYYSTMFAERMTAAGIRLAGAVAGAAGSAIGSVAGKTAASQFARDNGLMGTGGSREAAGRSENRSENRSEISAQSSSSSEQSLAAMSS